MFANISVFDNDVNDVEGIQNEAGRSVCLRNGCVWTQTESRKDRWYEWRVVRDLIEHRMVGTIIHGAECGFQLNCSGHGWLSFFNYRNERNIDDVMVFVDRSEILYGSR
jgi:hypothetical protein